MANVEPQDTSAKSLLKERATWLIGLAAFSGLNYAVLLWLSGQFASDVPNARRPTILMLVLFGQQFIFYGCALWLAVRIPPTKWLTGGIFAAACLFRGVLLPSVPMHEIDIYRYLWDGAVLAEGVSPYRYPPQQVIDAVKDPTASDDATLQQLVHLQASSISLSQSLHDIHYGEYPSPYPMTSQAVFALAAQVTPDSATRPTRLVIMKSLLVFMDLATLVVVMLLVQAVGLHPGWSLAYGWCPLLMKEFANGGHLDSIAIFLTTLAIWLLVKMWQTSTQKTALKKSLGAVCTGTVLALAIGAKLYPVVLLPLFAAVWLRRTGWAAATAGLASTALVSTLLLYSLFGPTAKTDSQPTRPTDSQLTAPGQVSVPTMPEQSGVDQSGVDTDEGIQAFLKQWEMNDLIFMIVLENLRQQTEVAPEHKPWFVVTSPDWSRAVVTRWIGFKYWISHVSDELASANEPPTAAQLKQAAFSLARAITGGAFALVACLLAWLAAGKKNPQAWCRAGLLTLAWFWFTCPTQNPWYWCWVLPLLPFARYRTWYFVAATTMLYYIRFWYIAHYPSPPVHGTPYDGTYFFYYVIVWVEFLPILVALPIEWLWSKRKKTIPAA